MARGGRRAKACHSTDEASPCLGFRAKTSKSKEEFCIMATSPLYRLWLIFSQAATIAVAALFVVSTFRPEWLPPRAGAQVALSIAQPSSAGPMQVAARTGPAPASYYDAVQRATPSLLNIFTSKEVRAPRHPLLNDPIFRRFFGDQLPDEAQRAASLGSGVIVSSSGRSEEHTSELQSRSDLVCRLLLEKKKKNNTNDP